jgi:ribosome maturation factor RimP
MIPVKKRVPWRPFFVILFLSEQRERTVMKFTPREAGKETGLRDPENLLLDSLEPVVKGLGMSLIELDLFQRKGRGSSPGSVQIKAVIYHAGSVGVNDCSKAHRAMFPRIELAFPGRDIFLEVSSPGIDRLIKDGSEFLHFTGRGVKCYSVDSSLWIGGLLQSADEKGIVLKTRDGEMSLVYDVIAKAKLDPSEDEIKRDEIGG